MGQDEPILTTVSGAKKVNLQDAFVMGTEERSRGARREEPMRINWWIDTKDTSNIKALVKEHANEYG